MQLGLVVEYHWKFKDPEQARKITVEGFDFIILDPSDKQTVRDNIMGCLYKCANSRIQKQYIRSITKIVALDFPNQWPNFVQEISTYLSQQDEKALLTGLQALYCVIRKYEYELDEEREPLYSVIQQTIELLGNLINVFINVESETAY